MSRVHAAAADTSSQQQHGTSNRSTAVPPIDISRCSPSAVGGRSKYYSHQQLKSQRHNVHVMFLTPDTRSDYLLNRLTSMLGKRVHKQGFCHTEIVIPDMEHTTLGCPAYLSSSIYNGETVTLTKTKTFANPGGLQIH